MNFSIYLLALAAVLGGLFLMFKPEASSPPAKPATTGAATSLPAAAPPPSTTQGTAPPVSPPAAQVFDLVIRRGQLVSGPAVLQVHKGDDVIVHLTSDSTDELHLHGYDLHVKTRAGETTTLQFNAARTGRFGYELHHTNAELGALEVYPR